MNKLILFLLMLLPTFAHNQQKVVLCGNTAKEYSIVYEGDTFTVDIQPSVFYQVENNKVYVTYSEIGTYLITATAYSNNCYKEDKFLVDVVECDSTLIWVPNAFTPNYDGKNYEFGAYGINVLEFNMAIYTRWGECIFTSNNILDRWDGFNKKKNIPYQEDVYVYKIIYRDNKKRFHEIFGRITLIH